MMDKGNSIGTYIRPGCDAKKCPGCDAEIKAGVCAKCGLLV